MTIVTLGPTIPRRCIGAMSSLLVLVSVTACTVPSDNGARPIDPTRLVAASSSKLNCTSAGVEVESTTVSVYLVSTQDEPPAVTPVDRVLPSSANTLRTALDALFDCRVSTEETRAGLATVVPEETRLLGLDQIAGAPGYYEVRLGPLQNRGSTAVDDLDKVAVAQIFFTLTSPGLDAEVKGLRFSIDGRAVAVSTDRRTVSRTDFVTREDFVSSSPPDTSGTRTTVTRAAVVAPTFVPTTIRGA